jgi:glycosyltransferase involved in cell wall biosynthesis
MMEMITGLSKLGKIKVKIISLKEGPLRVSYEERGIPVQVLPFDSLSGSNSYYQEGLKQWSTRVGILDCDMLYANTMNCFFAIDAANNNMIPSVWNIRESNYSKESFGVVSNAVASRAFGCFQYPYRVVFVSKATQEMFIRYNKSNNFDLIRNVLAPKQEETSCLEFKSIPSETLILLNVGTICKRKAQEEIVTAFETLSEPVLRKVALVFLGDKSSSYAKSLEARVKANEKIKNKVIFIDSNKDTASWYKRASVFVFSSRNESYPRVILEAMNYKLPIITTSVFGIKEQVIPEFNAIVYDSGDYKTLKVAMEKLISNQDLRDSLSSKSQIVLGSLGSYNQMLKKYEETFLEAASSS